MLKLILRNGILVTSSEIGCRWVPQNPINDQLVNFVSGNGSVISGSVDVDIYITKWRH